MVCWVSLTVFQAVHLWIISQGFLRIIWRDQRWLCFSHWVLSILQAIMYVQLFIVSTVLAGCTVLAADPQSDVSLKFKTESWSKIEVLFKTILYDIQIVLINFAGKLPTFCPKITHILPEIPISHWQRKPFRKLPNVLVYDILEKIMRRRTEFFFGLLKRVYAVGLKSAYKYRVIVWRPFLLGETVTSKLEESKLFFPCKWISQEQ